MCDYVRIGCNAMQYSWIAMVNYADAKECLKQAMPICDDPEKMTVLCNKAEKHVAIAITFSAMAMESFFNDYCAKKLGDSFYEDNLEMLRPIGKVQLIAKFIFGCELLKGERLYQLISGVYSARNAYVHNKSKDGRKLIMNEGLKEFELKEFDWDYLYEAKREEIRTEVKLGENAIIAMCEVAKFFEEKDENSQALFMLLHSNSFGSYDQKELRKVKSVQKEFGIPQVVEL